jgi:lipopolysaccharide transport system permease protein
VSALDVSSTIVKVPLVDDTTRVLAPVKRRLRLRDILGSRSVVRVLSARDFKVKYKQSVLGPVWLVFQPLALLLGFIVAFKGLGNVNTDGVPYPLFALCGLSAWSFFQAALNMGAPAIISNAPLMRFTPCPRVAPLMSAMISSLPSFAVTVGASLVWSAAAGDLSVRAFLLPLALLWLLVLTFGAIAFCAAVATHYRDMISALPFLLQVGTFLAPVGYSLHHLTNDLRIIVEINPISGVIEVTRWLIVAGYRPSMLAIYISAVATLVVFAAGWLVFSRMEPTFSDVI